MSADRTAREAAYAVLVSHCGTDTDRVVGHVLAALAKAGRLVPEVNGDVVEAAWEAACADDAWDAGDPDLRRAIEVAAPIIAADAERRVRAAVLEETAAHFDALAADIGAFATDRVATIIRALKDKSRAPAT